MKRILLLTVIASLALIGCGDYVQTEEDKIYTEEELGVIVEWIRGGWSEVKNETGETVTLVTSYPFGYHEDVTSEIPAGEAVKLDIGAAAPGTSIGESSYAVISLSNGDEIVCIQAETMTPWAERFYTNFEKEETYEVVDLDGKKLRHDLVILTYHIDQTLIDLWKNEQLTDGLWPPIQLDRPEVNLPSKGGTIVISMLNYKSWWIACGYSAEPDAEGVWQRIGDYIYGTTSVLDSNWFHAAVPNDGQSPQLVITVDENTLEKPRYAVIMMESGDVFTTIKISQS